MIYRCNNCGEYFGDEDRIDLKPDIGSFHICGSDDFDTVYDKKDLAYCEDNIIAELNGLRIGK